jgi:O-antigen biosynthesis protein
VFGKGYGEEVDFCQRIRKQGYICTISNRSFVYHLEARSFSLDRKSKLIEASSKIINERYPEYKQEVREYISQASRDEAKIYGLSGRLA